MDADLESVAIVEDTFARLKASFPPRDGETTRGRDDRVRTWAAYLVSNNCVPLSTTPQEYMKPVFVKWQTKFDKSFRPTGAEIDRLLSLCLRTTIYDWSTDENEGASADENAPGGDQAFERIDV